MSRHVTDLIIYPVKSLGGVRLQQAKVEVKGLAHDRRWMLVDDNNRFLTIRQHPEFLAYEIRLEDGHFIVHRKGETDHSKVPLQIESGEQVTVQVWDDTVSAIAASNGISEWFANKLGINCRLVFMPDAVNRPISKQWSANGSSVSFADGYPLLITGEQSLEALNARLTEAVTMSRFRPNIVFSGGVSYEEFRWSNVLVGNLRIQGLKPCARCVVTTMDPETYEKGSEPLKTLAQQKVDGKIVFGQHARPVDRGLIRVGDAIYVESWKDSPYDPI